MDNQLAVKQEQPLTVKNLFARDEVRNKFQELLGKRAPGFITSVLQAVASNQLLSKAEPASVYHSAAVAATLDLPLNNNLGFAYIVPYNQSYKDEAGNWQKKQVAQFQMGYKGFIQLAQRSGQFKTIAATKIFDGQLVESNPLTGYKFDFTKKDSDKIIGYASFFQLLNGFEKTLYMTVEELKAHGARFSQTAKSGKGLWNDDFEGMAIKTVLKLLLSKFAPLSIEMQKAVITDQAVINDADKDDVTYVDHEVVTAEIASAEKENDRVTQFIQKATTKKQLLEAEKAITTPEQKELFETKMKEVA
jgi:recombination protein RecT